MEKPWNTELFHKKLIELRQKDPQSFGAIYDSLKTSLTLTQLVTDNKVVDFIAKFLKIKTSDLSISEPMCRLGADVTGIDASEKNIKVASLHAKKNGLNIKYTCCTPETFRNDLKFDVNRA